MSQHQRAAGISRNKMLTCCPGRRETGGTRVRRQLQPRRSAAHALQQPDGPRCLLHPSAPTDGRVSYVMQQACFSQEHCVRERMQVCSVEGTPLCMRGEHQVHDEAVLAHACPPAGSGRSLASPGAAVADPCATCAQTRPSCRDCFMVPGLSIPLLLTVRPLLRGYGAWRSMEHGCGTPP